MKSFIILVSLVISWAVQGIFTVPLVSITYDPFVAEGESLKLTFIISEDLYDTAAFMYATGYILGGAIAGENYEPARGVMYFTPSSKIQTLSITTLRDSIYEGGAILNFSVSFSNAENVTLPFSSVVVGVKDIELEPVVEVLNLYAVAEGHSRKVLFSLSTISNLDCSFIYYTKDGTAIAGKNYMPQSGLLRFPPMAITRGILMKTILSAEAPNPDLYFYMIYNSTAGCSISAPDSAVIIFADGATSGQPASSISGGVATRSGTETTSTTNGASACMPGYVFTTSCTDIDECALSFHNCTGLATCANNEGSFSCECPSGYKLASDFASCEDIDECAEQISNCTSGLACNNTVGSFSCICPSGFSFDSNLQVCEQIHTANTPKSGGGNEAKVVGAVLGSVVGCAAVIGLALIAKRRFGEEAPEPSIPDAPPSSPAVFAVEKIRRDSLSRSGDIGIEIKKFDSAPDGAGPGSQ